MADEKNLKKGKIRTFIEDVLLHKDEPHQEPSPEAKRRRKKGIIISCVLVAILIAVIIGVCIPVIRFLQTTDSATLRDYVHQEGWKAILIFFLINILQTMTTVVPDGPFEIASGAVFGVGLGTLINDLAVTAGSLVAFTLSRLFGMRFVTLFVDEEKIRSHNLTHMTPKKTMLVSIAFLIPGFPKDFFTYLLGLSDINPVLFTLMVFFCRMPGVALTVLSGDALAARQKTRVILLWLLMLVILGCGLVLYSVMEKKRRDQKAEEEKQKEEN